MHNVPGVLLRGCLEGPSLYLSSQAFFLAIIYIPLFRASRHGLSMVRCLYGRHRVYVRWCRPQRQRSLGTLSAIFMAATASMSVFAGLSVNVTWERRIPQEIDTVMQDS